MSSPTRLSLIYVNPIEFHGKHLPLTTDYEISQGLWARLRTALESQGTKIEVLSTREIHRGCDPAHGPGTEFTSLRELKRLLREICTAVEAEKPDLVLFMTFHGAPRHAAAIEHAICHLRSRGIRAYNPFNHVLKKMLQFDPASVTSIVPLIQDAEFRPRWARSVPHDFHGGLFETSVLLAIDESKVLPIYKNAPDCPDREMAAPFKWLVAILRTLGFKEAAHQLAFGADALAWARHKTYYGYTGKPRLARPEIGEAFIKTLLKDYVQDFVPVLEGQVQSPKPVLQWTFISSA